MDPTETAAAGILGIQRRLLLDLTSPLMDDCLGCLEVLQIQSFMRFQSLEDLAATKTSGDD